jgi:hypothetical protein
MRNVAAKPGGMAAIPTRSDQPQAARAGAGRRTARLLRAHPADPTRARPALAALLLATADLAAPDAAA